MHTYAIRNTIVIMVAYIKTRCAYCITTSCVIAVRLYHFLLMDAIRDGCEILKSMPPEYEQVSSKSDCLLSFVCS